MCASCRQFFGKLRALSVFSDRVHRSLLIRAKVVLHDKRKFGDQDIFVELKSKLDLFFVFLYTRKANEKPDPSVILTIFLIL